jgi:hypothetical protein
MRNNTIAAAVFTAACAEEPTLELACAAPEVEIEIAPPSGDFGDLHDGDDLFCGSPPQGGAPYTPLRFRAVGPEVLGDGVDVRVTAVDVDTEEVLGDTQLTFGVVCANAGDSAGYWTGSEVHLRYDGWELPDLQGRRARVTFGITAYQQAEPAGSTTSDVTLACVVPQ